MGLRFTLKSLEILSVLCTLFYPLSPSHMNIEYFSEGLGTELRFELSGAKINCLQIFENWYVNTIGWQCCIISIFSYFSLKNIKHCI